MNYNLFAIKVMGEKHEVNNQQCQDAAEKYVTSDMQMIAVADGHGAKTCFRSHLGSQFAIQAVFDTVKSILSANDALGNFSVPKIKQIVSQNWRYLVHQHYSNNPITAREYLEANIGNDIFNLEPYHLYGTTLLFALSTKEQIFLLQIGDGSCVMWNSDGSFCMPIENDADNKLNVTSSLSSTESYEKMRHRLINFSAGNDDKRPVAIFLNTDGLDNCFKIVQRESAVFKFYDVVLQNVIDNGFEITNNYLKNELPILTKQGSTDDISVAYMIADTDLIKRTYEKLNLKNCKEKNFMMDEKIFGYSPMGKNSDSGLSRNVNDETPDTHPKKIEISIQTPKPETGNKKAIGYSEYKKCIGSNVGESEGRNIKTGLPTDTADALRGARVNSKFFASTASEQNIGTQNNRSDETSCPTNNATMQRNLNVPSDVLKRNLSESLNKISAERKQADETLSQNIIDLQTNLQPTLTTLEKTQRTLQESLQEIGKFRESLEYNVHADAIQKFVSTYEFMEELLDYHKKTVRNAEDYNNLIDSCGDMLEAIAESMSMLGAEIIEGEGVIFDPAKHKVKKAILPPRQSLIDVKKRGFAYKGKVLKKAEVTVRPSKESVETLDPPSWMMDRRNSFGGF